MPKFASSAVLFLVDGYNLLGQKIQTLRYKVVNETEPSDGVGDEWREHSPTGMRSAELAQEGAFFRTDAGNGHVALKDTNPTAADGALRIACVGNAGNVIGQPFVGFEGAVQPEYEVLAQVGLLQRANAAFLISGAAEDGVILHEHSVETADANTEAESVDHAAELQRVVPIVSSSVADPSIITTTVPHGLATGDTAVISGHVGSTPAIDGEHVVTVISETTFSIPVNVTVGGTGGTLVQGKSNAGGSGYLQVEEVTLGGHTGALVAIRDSDDDITFADLLTFTTATARGAQRVAVAGAVERYLASSVDFEGAGSGPSIKFFCGFARN